MRLTDGRVMGIGARCGTIDARLTGWQPTACPRDEHAGGAFVALSDGGLLAAAGGTQDHPLASAEMWDPRTGRWSAIVPMNTARSQAWGASLPGDGVLVAGSSGAGVEVWSPAENRWSANTDLPAAVTRIVQPRNGPNVLELAIPDGNSRMWTWRAGP